MSQICNRPGETPAPLEAKGHLEDRVEGHMVKGSAFFCGAFAEMMHLMAATELKRTEVLARHFDTAVAYLEGSVAEYDQAIRKAGDDFVDERRADAIARLDYTQLYEESVRRLRIPEIPSIWARLKLVAHSEAPAHLLSIFRDELTSCLGEALRLRESLETESLPSAEILWALGTRLTGALTTGQAIAVIYQLSLRDDAPSLPTGPRQDTPVLATA